jgi:hypothetical protein
LGNSHNLYNINKKLREKDILIRFAEKEKKTEIKHTLERLVDLVVHRVLSQVVKHHGL